MTKVLVLYYSSWGHVERMAEEVAAGAAEVAGVSVDIKRVPELAPPDVVQSNHFKTDQKAPIASPNELADYDAIIIGTPTRFGIMAAQMKNFLDQTGGLWAKGAARSAGSSPRPARAAATRPPSSPPGRCWRTTAWSSWDCPTRRPTWPTSRS